MKPISLSIKLSIGLVLLAPVVVVVNLQHDATNLTGWQKSILEDYANGTIGDKWTDGVEPIIIRARILMRILLGVTTKLLPVSLHLANLVLQTLFLGSGCFLLSKIVRTHMKLPFSYSLIALFLALLYICWGFLGVGYSISYPYDIPGFFFSAACLYALFQNRFWLFSLALFFGTLNKETLVFYIPAYVFLNLKLSQPGTLKDVLPKATVAFLVYLAAYFLPRIYLNSTQVEITASADGGQDYRFFLNLAFLAGKNGWGLFENFFWVLCLHLPGLVCIRSIPRSLQTVYLSLPFFLIPQFVFGNINELRLFNEWIPLGVLSASLLMARAFDTVEGSGEGVA